jgi:hypothetical protein
MGALLYLFDQGGSKDRQYKRRYLQTGVLSPTDSTTSALPEREELCGARILRVGGRLDLP